MFVQVVVKFIHMRQRIYDTWRVAHIRNRLVIRNGMRRLRKAAERDHRARLRRQTITASTLTQLQACRRHRQTMAHRRVRRYDTVTNRALRNDAIWCRCKETAAFTQRDKSGTAFIRFTYPSFQTVYLSDLAIRFSVFRQSLSDLTLDRSKVRPDKLLCVNRALESVVFTFPDGLSSTGPLQDGQSDQCGQSGDE